MISRMARFSHQKRLACSLFASQRRSCFFAFWVSAFVCVVLWQTHLLAWTPKSSWHEPRPIPKLRPHVFNISEFGAVGNGKTLNTAAFEKAIDAIAAVADSGGGQLNVPAGLWLTGPFNLTSHITLFLAEGSIILGVQDEAYWPIMPPLPSYGRGREYPGPRYGSLLHGEHLKDIVVTGHNGTVDGQGKIWWLKHKAKKLQITRGPLLQLMWCKDVLISDVTFRNSPFWTIHPFDCKNVTIRGVTILNPIDSPNTDGIDPDSCQNVLIENCYISVGDDCIAIKSGWDQYGIAYGQPSTNIVIRNITAHSPVSAGVSIGSEMSGGVMNVSVENLYVWSSKRGVRIKTARGRGGYITQIIFKNVTLDVVRVGIVIKTDYEDHPDRSFDPKALPRVENISFHGIHGKGVRIPVRLYGSLEVPVEGLEFRDVNVGVTRKKKHIFQCSYVRGKVIGDIYPRPCASLDVYAENGALVQRASLDNYTQN